MSFWLKRVESFLEQVDQTAATQIGSLKHDDPSQANTSYEDTQYSNRSTNGQTTSIKSKTSTTSSAPPPKPKDDDIFKFLNDDATPPPSSVQRLAMPVPKPKKDPKKKSVTAPVPTPTPTTLTSAPAPQPTKPATPPSPPPPSTRSTPPPSPPREPAQQTTAKEPELTLTELEPKLGLKSEPTEQSEPKEQSEPARSEAPVEVEGGEKGGWDDGDVVLEEEGKKSPRSVSPPSSPPPPHSPPHSPPRSPPAPRSPPLSHTENHVDTEDQKIDDLGDKTEVAPTSDAHTQNEPPVSTEQDHINQEEKEEKKEQEEEVKVAEVSVEAAAEAEAKAEAEAEAEAEEEEEDEDDSEGGLNAEIVQKYNDMITQNEKFARENKLMRQEVVKLHEEIHSLTNKNRSVSEALEQLNEVLSEHQKMAHDKDKQLIKMKQQEQELETALHAKDMQIAGARAQFEQVEKTLRMREATLTSYQERIEKLTQDKENLLDGNQRNTLHIQSKVDELDKLMNEEKRLHMETQKHAKEREAELQAGLAEYTKALAIAQRGLDEKTLELQRSTILLKEAQNESKTLRQELVDYKLRATKVLQSKEKTIQELTDRLSAGPDGGGNMSANLGELLRTQQELLRAQQERDELSHTVDQLRSNLQEIQAQAEADAEVFHSQLASSEEMLEKERKRVQALQLELLTRSNESASAHNEAERSLAELKETLKARDTELAKLRKQISSKSQSSASQMELENRLRSTTDHLLQKQAQIDTLLSEKSFLQLQLENTLQAAHRDLMAYKKRERQPYANKNDHVPISIKTSGSTDDDHDEPRIRQRSIASLVPANPYNPNFVSQRVVGAANFLDKMSASAGRVMRQYPLARLGVIAYIVLIHLMGFYIMASWNPEMHIDGLEDQPPPG